VSPAVDVLIPTYHRPAALAVTLASLAAQDMADWRVVISDQSRHPDDTCTAEVAAVLRVLRLHGHGVEVHRHLPRRGMAEQRQFLLDQARAPYALFLDDDCFLEPFVLGLMLRVIRQEGCGFVGCAVIGLSYLDDVRPHEQAVELWHGPVEPEVVEPGLPAWERWPLHNAANLYHVQRRLGATPEQPLRYKVAWVGGCVMYDTRKLRDAGGYGFWPELGRHHSGEDALAQLRVMARYGGCGIMPSGVYHQELPTTITDRRQDAPRVLAVQP